MTGIQFLIDFLKLFKKFSLRATQSLQKDFLSKGFKIISFCVEFTAFTCVGQNQAVHGRKCSLKLAFLNFIRLLFA